jgi:hypothetical protein
MSELAIFDLDGTIAPLPTDRKWEGSEFNWPNFMNWMDVQKPFGTIMEMVKWHRVQGHQIVVVTARPESYRQRTTDYLKRNRFPFDELIMRDDDLIEQEIKQLDGRDEDSIKSILFTNHSNWRIGVRSHLLGRGDTIKYAYDDQYPNLVVWRQAGAIVYQLDEKGLFVGV